TPPPPPPPPPPGPQTPPPPPSLSFSFSPSPAREATSAAMTLSSLLAWKTAAVSSAPGRAFAALARAGPLLAPAVGARAPAKGPPSLPAAPLSLFFFSSGTPSPAARKPGGAAAGAEKASSKPRKAKAGAAKAKKAAPAKAARKTTAAAKHRLGATKKGAAAKAKTGRAGAQASAKSAKTRAVAAKAKTRAVAAKAKARAVAKAKARAVSKARKDKARAVAKARKARDREAKAKAKARAAAKAKAGRARGKKESIRAETPDGKKKKGLCHYVRLAFRPLTYRVFFSFSLFPMQAYKEKAHASTANFGPAMERWIGSLTPEQKALAISGKFLKMLPGYKARVIRRTLRKSTPNLYASFVKAVCPEVRAAVKRDRPDLAGRQLQMATFKLMGEKWKGLSDEQKKVRLSPAPPPRIRPDFF
ncbi:MAG: hypothetical protein BJ554DRAFT_4727, partial [Olpidium bornovanus]